MIEGKESTNYVVARLLDFFQPGERWFRGLWTVGTVLSLRELSEAAEAAAHKVLSEAAVRWLSADVLASVMSDSGVPSNAREVFQKCLKKDAPRFSEANWHSLNDLTVEVNEGYLSRWADAVVAVPSATKKSQAKPERVARCIGAHLLDAGFSPQFLAEWLRQKIADPKQWSLLELLVELDKLVRLPPINYSVLILVNSGIRIPGLPREWTPPEAAKKLLLGAGIPRAPFRYGGGWLLSIDQKDGYSAAADAFDDVDRRSARLRVGRGQNMVPLPHAYVFGEVSPLHVLRNEISHGIRIKSIERQNKLFGFQPSNPIDAAFELLAQLDGSAAIAAAAGWAATEALLAGQSEDKVLAAERLATLVAASFPRAELTALAAKVMRSKSALAASLRGLRANRERAQSVADAIAAGDDLGLVDWSDRAAIQRMRLLMANPGEHLDDVSMHVARTIRRYYRQRNLVLHWGKTSPIALRAALRTGMPLLAAGVDRIAHAWFVQGITPIDLATRARSRLDLVGRPGRRITELLEGLGSDDRG